KTAESRGRRYVIFFFQAEDGIRDSSVTGVQTCALPISAVLARQILMPAINRATDHGEQRRFARLHGASVVLTLVHIVLSGGVLQIGRASCRERASGLVGAGRYR